VIRNRFVPARVSCPDGKEFDQVEKQSRKEPAIATSCVVLTAEKGSPKRDGESPGRGLSAAAT
jgi:hypothetical protein